MRFALILVLLSIFTSACDDSQTTFTTERESNELSPNFQVDVTGGCGDAWFYALEETSTNEVAAFLVVSVRGLLAEALAAEETLNWTLPVIDSKVSFELVVGERLTRPCNDVAEENDVAASFSASEGTITITIEPGDASLPEYETRGQGTILLEGVQVGSGEDSWLLEDIAIEDVALGWLPG